MPERFLLDITRVEITDHRGAKRVVPLLDALGPPRGFANHPGSPALWSIRKHILRRTWLAGMLLGGTVTLVIAGVLGTIVLVPRLNRTTADFFFWVGVSIPLFILGYERLVLPIFRRMYRPAFTDGALAIKLCPFCLYDLSSIAPDADGARTCPECAGGWRLAEPSPPA